ncbi:MAG: 30S ribosomal protein THX [Cyclobacteriaceae bacterium]|nr:30S ribosomal protein THX [Cyclobacteriaceae bacterium]
MGKGDVKTKKGKIAKGSFGNKRPKRSGPTVITSIKMNKSESPKPKKKTAAKEKK